MILLTQLASILGIEVDELVSSSRRKALMWAVIALLAITGLAFLLVAAYLGMSLWVGPIWAALTLAVIAITAAAIIYAVARVTADIAHRREVERRRSAETTALVTTAAATALPLVLKSPMVRNVGIPVGAALAALFFAMRSDNGDAGKR